MYGVPRVQAPICDILCMSVEDKYAKLHILVSHLSDDIT